jgi:hypothetical protein
MSIQEVPSASGLFTVPDDVANYCREKGLTADLAQALGIVRTAYPGLRKPKIALEDHEVLGHAVLISGEVRDTPTNVAKRNWDCIGQWVDALRRDALPYFLLDVDPEGE